MVEMPSTQNPLTILCVPLSTSGHVNTTIAISGILKERGHRIFIATERSWQGKFVKLGFEEEIYDEIPLPEGGEPPKPNEFQQNIIKEQSRFFRLSPLQQLPSYLNDMKIFTENVQNSDKQIQAIIQKVKPDLILQDHYVCYPSIVNSSIPWVLLCSANPMYLFDGPQVPPAHSGLPTTNVAGWEEFRQKRLEMVNDLWKEFNKWVVESKCPPLESGHFQYISNNLNVYVYPKSLDYTELLDQLGDEWCRIDSVACFGKDALNKNSTFEVPEQIANLPGKLIYFSLGSLGSGDVDLMKELIKTLSKAPHRFIVSKGPFHDQYELAPNMWGGEYLPQLAILPKVDLVITHGGNNSLTESLFFGKPLIVMPLFWDQHDNAQRIVERKLGARFNLSSKNFDDLLTTIENVLNDEEMKKNAVRVSSEIDGSKSVLEAVDKIEKVARNPKFPIVGSLS